MKKKGTTLIEVLLYTVIAGFFVTSITMFAWDASSTKNRSDSQVLVNDSAQVATNEILKSIKNATAITSPITKGEISGALSLSYPGGNSKTFDLVDGRVRMQTAGGTYLITPEETVVDELTFTNLGRASTPGLIELKLHISHQNPENLAELKADIKIITSGALRL